jgi:hypothetical protein
VVVAAVFRGDATAMRALMAAVEHNCTCDRGGICPAHRALLDQRWLDGLLFARWLHERLLAEETTR